MEGRGLEELKATVPVDTLKHEKVVNKRFKKGINFLHLKIKFV